MKKLVVYVHGKGGNAAEAEHYKPLFPGCDVIGFDYTCTDPEKAREEYPRFFADKRPCYDLVILIANSIGAFYSMSALTKKQVDRAFFISPIVNMEKLISDMMMWAGVTEEELCTRGEIPTDFGETLSWKYLCYVREHPLRWDVPTCILYGEKDNLTAPETAAEFAAKTGASLTVMAGGEHWFHTEEQMNFLDKWIKEKCSDIL